MSLKLNDLEKDGKNAPEQSWKEQLAEFQEAFLGLTRGEGGLKGSVSIDNLRTAFIELMQRTSDHDEDLQDMIRAVNITNTGEISFSEFVNLMQLKDKDFSSDFKDTEITAKENLRAVFREFDQDRDGLVSVEEFSAMWEKYGSEMDVLEPPSAQELISMMYLCDKNHIVQGQPRISFEAFYQLVTQPDA